MDNTNDNGGYNCRDVGAGRLENVIGVEDDGVDATELLEEHETKPDDERHARTAVGQHAEDSSALTCCVIYLQFEVKRNVRNCIFF